MTGFHRARLRACAVRAAAFALVLSGPAAAQGGGVACAGDLPSICLQSFGAGSAALNPEAVKAECGAKLQSYRRCIADVATQAGLDDLAGPPLTRSEFGFLSALEAELADNVGRLETFIAEKMNLDGTRAIYPNDWPSLRMRFFNSTTHPAYFIAPADWLARTQGFYDDTAAFLERAGVRDAFRRQVTSVLFQRRQSREELEALVATARTELLPEISAVLAAAQR
ncbi:MAG: hypothetical protein AAF909_05720 [Pseudomonadota bacterium]